MRRSSLGLVGFLASALTGCSDHPYDPNTSAIDPNAPRVHITSPARGTFAGDVNMVTVAGTATDDHAVTSVTVNDVPATLADDGTFTATVPVVPGTNLIHAVAMDAQGNAGKESRAVVAGPMSKIDMQVPDAIRVTLSAETFAAISKAAGTFLQSGNIPMHNPVIDVGGGPDCLYGQGSVTSLTIGGATVQLVPQAGGLHVDVELDQLNIGMHLQYAAACISGSRDITVAASQVAITGDISVGVKAGAFDIQFVNSNVQLTGFQAELGGIPGAIVDLLHLDTALGPVVGWAAGKMVASKVDKTFASLTGARTVSMLGKMVDVSLTPSNIDFSSAGGIVSIDASLRAHGDTMSPGFVYIANGAPAMDLSHGFQLAIADDAPNQLFGSLWAANGLDDRLDLKTGPYGDVGKLYDSVELSAAVPPFVDASSPDGLKLTIGDLMATFRNGDATVTEIAINAQIDVKVTTGSDGAARLDVGEPTVYVDILGEGVTGANQLSSSQFETIASFALSRIIAVGAGSLGAIPLPSVDGISLTNLEIAEQTGYVVVDGEVQ
jgi:hypothetical protein